MEKNFPCFLKSHIKRDSLKIAKFVKPFKLCAAKCNNKFKTDSLLWWNVTRCPTIFSLNKNQRLLSKYINFLCFKKSVFVWGGDKHWDIKRIISVNNLKKNRKNKRLSDGKFLSSLKSNSWLPHCFGRETFYKFSNNLNAQNKFMKEKI